MTVDLRPEALRLLDRHWDEERGYCVPNPRVYPHLWLWDSCFHAIVFAHLGDARAQRELEAVLGGQLPDGMVPHMRYGPAGHDTFLGPLSSSSSLTQPPMYGHAAKVLAEHGVPASAETLAAARRGLEWFWHNRRTDDGLLYTVHPWEVGNDHSPRWDDWGAPGRTPEDYDRAARTAWNKRQMSDVRFGEDGAAVWSSSFVTCSAAFHAYTAFNMAELAQLLGDKTLAEQAERLGAAMDEHLWDPEERLWSDRAVVGGGPSTRVPISDGIMGSLVTSDRDRAMAALEQLWDPERFGAPYGPANVASSHPAYDPGSYWRGPAWPQLNYLLGLALRRWGLDREADELAAVSQRTAANNGWAEYWNPETGEGLGAAPQSWTTLVVAMTPTPNRGGH